MWTQPATDEQRRYYSKHSPKRRVYGWIMTLLQTAHGFLAFAAWTSIYLWVFKAIPSMVFLAPVLSISTLFALHILFRTTWDTFWYDRLDDDPNTDSSVVLPVTIFALLLFAEVNGAQQYLAGQVKTPEKQHTADIEASHSTTLSAFEQSYKNDVAKIEDTYKTKERAATAYHDRQIRNLRNRRADTDADRRSIRSQISAAETARERALAPVLKAKADALEAAYQNYNTAKTAETNRRSAAVADVDTHNRTETARYQSDMGNVSTYAWVLSVCLLALIAGLGYARVRINVKSGILPLRNYTVLDAHGSVIERFATAIGDAWNRRSLQAAVWFHKLLSPNGAVTSFDGTIVARKGTYNTPEGFFPENFQPLPHKTEAQAAQEVLTKMAQNPTVTLTPEQITREVQLAQRTNGHYKDIPLGKPEPSTAQVRTAEGTPAPHHPTAASAVPPSDYSADVANWVRRVEAQLTAYDQHILLGEPGKAAAIQDYVFTDPDSPIVKEGKRLRLEWGVKDGQFVVRRLDRSHYVPLPQVTADTLDTPTPAPVAADDIEEMFKQNIDLFKQNILPQKDANGKVIGIQYKKKGGAWTAYDYNTVRGQWGIYQRRAAKGEVSEAVQDGLEKWTYAMSLFEEGRAEVAASAHAEIVAPILISN